MTQLKAFVRGLSDKKEEELPGAVQIAVGASLDSPAMTMSGIFLLEGQPGELGEVRVLAGEWELFRGKVDCQQVTLSAQGNLLELEARSKGALLLDNEALPCTWTNVHVSAIFNRCIAPYGFTLFNPNPSHLLAVYTIRKDLCEWEALCGYTRRAFGITPYVVGDTVLVDHPRSATFLTLSNMGEGMPFTKLQERYIPYHIISQVILRDENGNYSAGVANSAAAYHKVMRKRYVIPSTEFMDEPALDANQRIRRSMRESKQIFAALPGIVNTFAGQQARVVDEQLAINNLTVREVRWQTGAAGSETYLWMCENSYG